MSEIAGTTADERAFLPAFFLPVVHMGQIMQSGQWPHHVTLFPPLLSAYDPVFGEKLRNELNPHAPFEVVTAGEALFGPEQDIPVRLIRPSLSLQGVHYLIERALGEILHDKTYRQPYRPHVTVKNYDELPEGASITIAGLSVVEKTEGQWTVVDKIGLRGEAS